MWRAAMRLLCLPLLLAHTQAAFECPGDVIAAFRGSWVNVSWAAPDTVFKTLVEEKKFRTPDGEASHILPRHDLRNGEARWGVGRYFVTQSAMDGAEVKTCKFSVTVLDKLAPTIDCPEGQLFEVADEGDAPTQLEFELYAVDSVDGDLSEHITCVATHNTREEGLVPQSAVTFSPSTGASFSVGVQHQIECFVRDRAENKASCLFALFIRDSGEAESLRRSRRSLVNSDSDGVRTEGMGSDSLDLLTRLGVHNSANVSDTIDSLAADVLISEENTTFSAFAVRMTSLEAQALFKTETLDAPPHSAVGALKFTAFDNKVYAITIRVDKSGESTAAGVDDSAASLGLESYVSMQVEKFDAQGQYLDSEVTFSVCLENQLGEKAAAIAVFRKGLQDKVFSEVSSIFQSPIAGCFQVTSMTSTFLIADVTGDWNRPTYPTPWSSAEHYVTDSLEPFGCDRSMAGGVGKECSERICPYGLVATANAHAADADAVYTPYGSADGAGAAVNGMHSYSECSAAGICDRAIGTCQCNDDRDGAACERSKCPNSCSFHGVCRTLSEVHSSGAALEEEDGLIGPTVAWNAGTYQQCDCDPGFFGGDCSLRRCPAGVNPFEECAEKSSFDIQQVDLSAIAADSFFVLEFTTAMGATFNTHPLPQDTSANAVQRALERLPNFAIPSVQVSRDTDVLQITFSDVANRGRQPLLDCNPDSLMSRCSSGPQPLFSSDFDNLCPVSRVGEPETDASKGYFEVSTCSSQGICDAESGNCECFDGFYGLACDMYAQVS